MQINFGRLGGQLGVLLCLLGFIVIFLGWNGAASRNFGPAQFPYLMSGGIAGLALVVVGAAMIIVQNQRADRARVEALLERLAAAVEKQGTGASGNGVGAAGSAGFVVAGRISYHRVDCHLPEAREEAQLIRIEEVVTRQLSPCRVCQPPVFGQLTYPG